MEAFCASLSGANPSSMPALTRYHPFSFRNSVERSILSTLAALLTDPSCWIVSRIILFSISFIRLFKSWTGFGRFPNFSAILLMSSGLTLSPARTYSFCMKFLSSLTLPGQANCSKIDRSRSTLWEYRTFQSIASKTSGPGAGYPLSVDSSREGEGGCRRSDGTGPPEIVPARPGRADPYSWRK